MADTVNDAPAADRRLVLRSAYDAAQRTVSIELAGGDANPAGALLAVTSVVRLTPPSGSAVRLVRQVGSYHEFGIDDVRSIEGLELSHRPAHANDGPVSAFLIRPDHTTEPVVVEPMQRVPADAAEPTEPQPDPTEPDATDADDRPAIVPFPVDLVAEGPVTVDVASLVDSPDEARHAWRAVTALIARVGAPTTLVESGGVATIAAVDASLADEAYELSIDGEGIKVVASSERGFRHAFVTVARLVQDGVPRRGRVRDAPHHSWRGLHIDLARQWFEPEVVERLIDVAAWRKLNRLHLHLTDDEAWRLPVDAYPQLGSRGATRGHGLPLPPMLGDDAGPSGRAYTAGEIARWVERADDLGVVLVPEFDVPGHMHAALTALPELRDPSDASGARSVQFFVDNVLVPGHPMTADFLTRVVEQVAALFPSSPWIHIGGDEVPDGAWSDSPVVDELRRERELTGTRAVEAEFCRDLVRIVRERTGRSIGCWQEAAESGGVRPEDGYVVGWRTADACRELAARGYDVVVSPGQAYYLDMSLDDDWSSPGAAWAGSTSLGEVCDFEPGVDWSDGERAHLIGVQACLWTEFVRDQEALDRMLFPRLDAIAERAWTGYVVGGAESLRRRARAA